MITILQDADTKLYWVVKDWHNGIAPLGFAVPSKDHAVSLAHSIRKHGDFLSPLLTKSISTVPFWIAKVLT